VALIVGFGLINVYTNQSEQRLGVTDTYQVENCQVKLKRTESGAQTGVGVVDGVQVKVGASKSGKLIEHK